MTQPLNAANADKYFLYQNAVQSPEADAEFLFDTYQQLRDKSPSHLREDFCGTCLLASHWIQLNDEMTAEAYDIDPEPLLWGQQHNLQPLGTQAQRCTQFCADARSVSERTPDIRCAQNFSYWIFTTRSEMLDYFRSAFTDLAEDGLFVIDLHGGPESLQEQEEETDIEELGYSYVWDQHHYDPISNEANLSIHFRFPDGSELNNAFTYHWRVWGLAELRDILFDAGFSNIYCYWEGTDEDGESGNGEFTMEEKGEACPCYVAYLVAAK